MEPVEITMPGERPGDGGDVLTASTPVPGATPADVVRAFTAPEVLRRWWGGGELTIELRPGGPYVVAFERLGQTMRGVVVEHDPAGRLAFTWSWDHDQEAAARTVTVTATPAAGGALLHLVHGPYPGGEADRAEAEGHRDGWRHFLPGIAGALG